MCMSANCQVCGGRTWKGCGNHVASAMSSYPKEEWCRCESASGAELNGFPPKQGDAK
ncbi:hypothetical protein CORT_0C03230 [Candida orthopsilosis Co 90-125]|uniref:Uncharacterized protein n=1 Tax=Candida orthopsilosis (strain 90-125) TaxID=1136231 RepID=H8X3R0_CANO9|nr:hypothetical protein CORT_0C03230 [Candida orthopsilosis Co 90-125]CCG25698.1 hypothetical protein CORT_0C03230 [Candida orthopsilosis Co 90-125]